MRTWAPAFLVVVAALWVAAGQSVQYVGRVQQSTTIAGAVQFEWSSVEIHTSYRPPPGHRCQLCLTLVFRFKGKAIDALLDSEGNVFEVFVDGVSVGLINTTSGVRQYSAASGLSSGVTSFPAFIQYLLIVY